MAKILLDYADGHYSTRPLSDEEAARLEAEGHDVEHVEDRLYDAWRRHCEEEGVWQALWRSISNERYVRRREKELLPLEEAAREIEHLKADLERAERMSRYFEGQLQDKRRTEHRAEYVETTCVFPQPGCQINVLPPKWRELATEILENYRADLAAEGMRHQGCCCGHTHEKLDRATEQQLRKCGFLVDCSSEEL